jgi:quercetin dioxygenase-like cupin family protein
MNDVKIFIESGILEMYVLGQTTDEENSQVEQMAALYNEVHNEIDDISIALEQYAIANAIKPDPMIQPFLMAVIDYMERLKNGEEATFPPALHTGSKIADYEQWLNRKDLEPTEKVTDVHASIIGRTPELTTAIVWLKEGTPPETHTTELEKFLILEGSCDITIGDDVHSLVAGDVLIIPLHKSHWVKVTSDCLCKVVLQRAAA